MDLDYDFSFKEVKSIEELEKELARGNWGLASNRKIKRW